MITTLENNVRYYNRKQDDKFYVDPEWKLVKERKYPNEKEFQRRQARHISNNIKDSTRTEEQLYRYNHSKYIISEVRKFRKNHQNNSYFYSEYQGEPFPETQDMSCLTETCKGCNRHYLLSMEYINHHDVVCKSCSKLPIPVYPLINAQPLRIDKIRDNMIKETVYIPRVNMNTSNLTNIETIGDIKYFSKQFTQEIVKAREQLKLTQEQLARRINCSANIIAAFEKGKYIYSHDLREKFNIFFNI